MNGGHGISADDGFAFAMLGIMVLSFSVIVMLIICMIRSAARRNREVDELLDEVAATEDQEKLGKKIPPPPSPEPWERNGDWWKP